MIIQLRNNGIYKLPGQQRSVFAFTVENDELYLYDTEMGVRLPPRYAVRADGKLINWFNDFPVWTVDDLTDTGETQEQEDK